jgi:RHS repeat-associated protein
MGCLKLTYHEETERSNFLTVWKKSDGPEKSTNYQSWGGVLREQKWVDLDKSYRYSFQGQFSEHDEETDWQHFELREYDPVIGRMLVPDPMRQYWSPYVAMGNNPVNLIDPTGGATDPKDGDLNSAGTQQWGKNGNTGEYGWNDILNEVTVTAGPENLAYNGAAIANFAAGREGWYLRGSALKDIRPINQSPVKNKSQYDCSGFVSYCVGQFHPELAKQLGGTTYEYERLATEQGGTRRNGPNVGDIALWKGHAGIIIAVSGESFTVSHSSGKDGAPVPKVRTFNTVNDSNLKYYGDNGSAGNGKFIGFWSPALPIGNNK